MKEMRLKFGKCKSSFNNKTLEYTIIFVINSTAFRNRCLNSSAFYLPLACSSVYESLCKQNDTITKPL